MKKETHNWVKTIVAIVVTLLVLLILLLIIHMIKNASILQSLTNLSSSKLNSTNYTYERTIVNDSHNLLRIRKQLGSQYVVKNYVYDEESPAIVSEYYDGTDTTIITEQNGTKKEKANNSASKNETLSNVISTSLYENWTSFDMILNRKISKLNDSNVYSLEYKGMICLVDGETGLPLVVITKNTKETFSFEFNQVTSNDLVIPNV